LSNVNRRTDIETDRQTERHRWKQNLLSGGNIDMQHHNVTHIYQV